MPSPRTPPTRSLRRPRKLRVGILLLSWASVPLAAAFGRGRSLVPTRSAPRPWPSTIVPGGVNSRLRDARTPPAQRVGRVLTSTRSGGGSDELNSSPKRPLRSLSLPVAALGLLAFTSGPAVAHAAKKGATAVTVAALAPPLVLPPISTLALVCLLPTLLGYYKSEYGVSYGYGTAIAASSFLVLSSLANAAGLPLLPALGESLSWTSVRPAGILAAAAATLRNLRALLPASLPACHAAALLFYGTRLDLFLLYREVFYSRFRAMRERIEERAKKQGGRLARTPFLISCALLYFCLATPLLVTSRVCEGLGMAAVGPVSVVGVGLAGVLEHSVRASVIVALLGFLLGAAGDLNKTVGKALQGEDALVTGGIFRFFRHPNYTGEVIGWVSSCLAGFLAMAWRTASTGVDRGAGLTLWKNMAPYLLASVAGTTGIVFVLATAATGLEFRQQEKYGETKEYQEWIKKSWVGFKMKQKDQGGDGDDDTGDKGGQ